MKTAYDLVIIGGGSAGLTAAETALLFKKKVAIVAAGRLGGECLWTGCVPSKTLLHAAYETHRCGGTTPQEAFALTQKLINEAQQAIVQEKENPEYFRKKGVDVYLDHARFVDTHTLALVEQTITAKYFLIATGSRPAIPPIPGIREIDYITNENVFTLPEIPRSMIILGGGPIGCELAQGFQRLGCRVTLLQRNARLLPKDEPAASKLILKTFQNEGITVFLNTVIEKVEKKGGVLQAVISENGVKKNIEAESLLVAAGRAPHIADLGLEKIGVQSTGRGVIHNSLLQTNIRHIYAAGDVAGDFLFTHFARVQAASAVRNMFLPVKKTLAPKTVPWVTFTDPEVANVGMNEEEIKEKNLAYRAVFFPYDQIDRAISSRNLEGFIKILISPKHKILGAQIVGARSGELIHELVLAMEFDIPVNKLISVIHAYPTYSSGIQQALFNDIENSQKTPLKLARLLTKLT